LCSEKCDRIQSRTFHFDGPPLPSYPIIIHVGYCRQSSVTLAQ
jgi:hypothetical protein